MSLKKPLSINTQDYYPLEDYMHTSSFDFEDYESVEKIAAVLFENSSLLGEYVFSDELKIEFINRAKLSVRKFASTNTPYFSRLEKRILFIAAIILSQNYDEDDNETQLWSYIISHLDCEYTISVENRFREIVKDVTADNNCFFANRGQKYYNTLNAHALTPSWSIEHLFNILYSFYARNLRSTYVENDIGFSLLVNNIKARWADESESEDLRLRSDALASSTKLLFEQTPGYMMAVCDALTNKLDMLLKGELDELDLSNRWDCLLKSWYDKKTDIERKEMKAQQDRASKEYTVTKKEQINAIYTFDNEKVYIKLPRIRLPEIKERPILIVQQDNETIYTTTMSVFGDELCFTTVEQEITLNSIESMDWSKDFRLRVKIQSGSQVVYDSETSLYRDYLMFKTSGSELNKINDNLDELILVAGLMADVTINYYDDDNNSYSFGDMGQMYYVDLYSVYSLFVAGRNLLSSTSDTDTPVFYCSRKSVPDVVVQVPDEEDYSIFDEAISIKAVIPNGQVPHNYFVKIDSQIESLSQYATDDNTATITLPKTPKDYHVIEIYDFGHSRCLYSLKYIVLPGFKLRYDRQLYKNALCSGFAEVRLGADKRRIDFTLEEDQTHITFSIWGNIICKAIVPKIEASLGNVNAFGMMRQTWYKYFRTGDFLSLAYPSGFECTVMLGPNYEVPAVKEGKLFELGNYLNSRYSWGTNRLDLGIIIRDKDSRLVAQEFLTEIVFEEMFEKSPIVVYERTISWNPEGLFVGPYNAEFKICLENDQEAPWEYSEFLEPDILEKRFPCREGKYKCTVFLVGEDNLFSCAQDKKLWEEQITIGNPESVRFWKKQIRLREVHYWYHLSGKNEKMPIRDGDCVITHLRYQGKTRAPYCGQHAPFYSGSMGFYKENNQFYFYNDREDSLDYELINPVKVWLVDDNIIEVVTQTEEQLLIETVTLERQLFARIANKKQERNNRSYYQQYRVADYFEYEVVDDPYYLGGNDE